MVNQLQIIDMLTAGLRGVQARQNVIADNIANAETPGYRRKTIEFEKALSRAMESGEGLNRPVEASVSTPDTGHADPTGNNVDLETEVGELIKNSSTYKAYLRILNKVYKQMETAMSVQ